MTIKFLNKKKKGQSLLIVIIVSTLALLIMLSMADRIILSRVNVQRSEEFDRSVSVAENQVNDIIKVFDDTAISTDCLQPVNSNPTSSNFVPLTCAALQSTDAKIYARISNNSALTITPEIPLTHIVGQNITVGQQTTGVVATCDNFNTSNPPKFFITRVYIENNIYYTDKAVYTCVSSFTGANIALGNVDFYTSRTGTSGTKIAGQGAPVTSRDTVFIRVKAYDDSQVATKVNIRTYSSSGALVTSTGKYEFLVTGLGDLGSDSGVTFEKPIAGNSASAPGFLDYVYFGEDL